MSTMLALCKRVHMYLGMGSRGNTARAGTVPESTAGQVDELYEIVQWFILAWLEFQNLYMWGWLKTQGTLPIISGTATVVPTVTIAAFREWVPFVDGGRKYLLTGQTAEQRCYYEPYERFRGYWDRAEVSVGRPIYFTIRPDLTFEFYPTPDQNYTARLDYLAKPQVLTEANGALLLEDYPATGRGLPDDLQDVICWMATRYYSRTRGDTKLLALANQQILQLLDPIQRRYLPQISYG